MRLLFLAPSVPFPLNEGLKVINYHLLRELSARHEISLLSLAVSPEEAAGAEVLQAYCKKLEVVHHTIPRSPFARLQNMLCDSMPFCVWQYNSRVLQRRLRQWVADKRFDVAHMTYTPMAQYTEDLGHLPCVLALVDCMSHLFASNALAAPGPFAKFYWRAQARKMRAYERGALSSVHQAVVVTPADRNTLPAASCPVRVIPCGVDADYFAPLPDLEQGPAVLFRGILSFPPNVDAARYFYDEIFPAIRRAIPSTRLILAGRDPAPLLRRLAATDPGITLTGSLPDLRPAMAQANVHVCPMRIGSGVKIKVLEAMAMGKAVVTTSLGLSGIPAVPGRDLMVADDPDSFAEAVIHLLRDSGLRGQIGSAARAFVVREHNWAAVAERYEETYYAARDAGAGGPGAGSP